ncbi:hypothetical protein ES708_09019 [subsurface metagenome]
MKIPDEYIPGFKKLISLDIESQEELISALKNAPIGSWDVGLSNFISQKTKIKSEIILDIVNLLFSLLINKRYSEQSTDKFLDQILSAIKDIKDPELLPSPELKELLTKLLSIKTIETTTKAFELENEREILFIDARIVTDIRPVFDDANSGNISGQLIINTLKLRYKDSEGFKSIYIAVDDKDLSKLKEQIIRAERKIKRINKGMAKVPFIKLKLEE